MIKINRSAALAALCFLVFGSGKINAQDKLLTIEDAFNPAFYPQNLSGISWVPKTHAYIYIKKNGSAEAIVKEDVDAGMEPKEYLSLEALNTAFEAAGLQKVKKIPPYQWVDRNALLFSQPTFLAIYNFESKKAEKLAELPKGAASTDVNKNNLAVAYTIDNNLFVQAKSAEAKNISNENNKGIVFGQSVHRNEFGINKGTFWSPNGNFLAFYRMDETMVTDYPLMNINEKPASINNIKYPMAGGKSHHVTLGIYNLATGTTSYVKTTGDPEQYLTNISWSPDEKHVYIAVLNRGQNHMQLNKYDAATGNFVKTLFEERSEKYVEPLDPMHFIPGENDKFLWLSQRDGFKHFYIYNTDGKLLGQLTKGKTAVINVLGFDENGKNVFYTATSENGLEIHPFSAEIKSKKITKLSKQPGVHGAYISYDGRFIIDNYTNPITPRKIEVYSVSGKPAVAHTIFTAENPVKDHKIGDTKVFTIKADDGTDLNCRMIFPHDMNTNKKYPVVTYVYGGPHAQMVNGGWLNGANLWMHYMAQKGYIVFTLDNRGSNNRGRDFEQSTFRKLGDIEVADQMKGVEYLHNLNYVDTARMGVHGWSYGGFMTTNLMLKAPGAYKVGVAGGPVIDWNYYEVMYTERYMDTPEENPDGYKNADLLNYVKNLNGRLLLIHGTVDDVVVWQHSLMFVKKAVDEGKMVDYFVYPGHPHNVHGKDRVHLYRKITQYFDDFLK